MCQAKEPPVAETLKLVRALKPHFSVGKPRYVKMGGLVAETLKLVRALKRVAIRVFGDIHEGSRDPKAR